MYTCILYIYIICRVGDRILKINDHSVIGKSPSQAQRLLGEVRWGEEVRILAMPSQETVIFRWVEEMDAGVIVMKVSKYRVCMLVF